MEFGTSGSGVMREAKEYTVTVEGEERVAYQYSFVGPLSLSKGCDFAIPLRRTNLDETQDESPFFDYAYRGLINVNVSEIIIPSCRREPPGGDRRHLLHELDSCAVRTESAQRVPSQVLLQSTRRGRQ